ncbi:MAG: membrane protein insertase YidC [Candidatus Nomurabacteria bacterium]|nr:membrane protein insertase YidC [Candidatus Nomurabacteria bacterium]USN87325.1 MAG: membrane protein insertase YidC [Candidatus Nomurabacteria bacterium]
MSYIWHTFFFDPVYNGLIFFIDIIPGGDVGVAIIATVAVVKFILLPLSIKAAKTQKIMREIEPKLREIKEKHKDNKEEQARAMMEIYRDAGMNPFASLFLVFLQIPIIIALYFSVYSGGGVALPEINTALLYSFVSTPSLVDMNFLGMIDISGKSVLLAALAGVTQYYQVKLAMPQMAPRDPNKAPDMKEDIMRNMQLQMRYVMPVIIFVVSYVISAAIALYFFVSNVAAILQELHIKKHHR